MVARENTFDEREINFRLCIDQWTRSVALRTIDSTKGVSSLHLDDSQGLLSSHNTLYVQNQLNLYECHNNMVRAVNMLYRASKRAKS